MRAFELTLVLPTMSLDDWCLQSAQQDIDRLYSSLAEYEELASERTHSIQQARSKADPTCQAQRLAAENLQSDLVQLSHYYSTLDRCMQRKLKPLAQQQLELPVRRGFEVAVRRGLLCLVLHYKEELLKWSKQKYRNDAVSAGALLPTGDDVDLEEPCQMLRIQKAWLQKSCSGSFSLKMLQDLSWVTHALVELEKIADAVRQCLAVGAAWENPLEELYLGAAQLLLQHGYMVKPLLATRKRIRGKSAPSVEGLPVLQSRLLHILALGSWIDLVEDWHDAPATSRRSRCVSNIGPMEIRSLGKLVDEERLFSSTPLIDHVCAMCGHLLHPFLTTSASTKDVGRCGPPCQERGKPLHGQWHAMPLHLLLWTKARIAKSCPALYSYNASTRDLRLRGDVASAPWLHFEPRRKSKIVSPNLPTRKGGAQQLCEDRPWWYCSACFNYWLPPYNSIGQKKVQRVPMRNYWEGYFTRWYVDMGYPSLHPCLQKLYPEHTTLPSIEDALCWQKKYKSWVELLRKSYNDDPEAAAAHCGTHEQHIEKVRQELLAQEMQWCPPPHLSKWKTPVPQYLYQRSFGNSDIWDLRTHYHTDLVPNEQWELVQDCLSDSICEANTWDDIVSADARACLSLCRPIGHYVKKRQCRTRGPIETTQLHQSGTLMLQPLTPAEDEARGMLGGLVAKDNFLKHKFEMRDREREVLPHIIAWLHSRNPWNNAYANSLKSIQNVAKFCEEVQSEGRAVGMGPFKPGDAQIDGVLGDESVAMFIPTDDFKAACGSYRHLRAAAANICEAELKRPLPPEWVDLYQSDLRMSDGKSMSQIPKVLHYNASFTNIFFKDVHVDAKVFVFQHRWGTGSYASTLDCMDSRSVFRRARFWSFDGVFQDNRDPEWVLSVHESLFSLLWALNCGRVSKGLQRLFQEGPQTVF